MRRGFSFRNRVLFSFLLVVALGVLVPSWFMRGIFLDGLAIAAQHDAHVLLDLALHELCGEGGADRGAQATADALGLGMAFVDSKGHVLARAGDPGLIAVLGAAPVTKEPRTVLDVETLREKRLLRAWRFVEPNGSGWPSGWIGVTMPHVSAVDGVRRVNMGMGLSLAAAIVLSGIFSLFLVRWLGRSMDSLIAVAEAIGRGRYKERAKGFHSRELDALSRSINGMAQRIESHFITIVEQKEQFEAVLESMNEGVIVLDASCRIRSVNTALLRVFPECRGAEGKQPLEVISSPELQQACQEVIRAVNERALRTFQIEPRKDAVYDVAIVNLKSRQSGPDALGAVAVFHDISTLSRLERVRSDFVSNVSHELRTPLTSIKGYAETVLLRLEQETGSARNHIDFMQVILRNANHMSKLVNDLLNLARMEDGKNAFEVTEVDAADALKQATRECSHVLRQYAGELDVRLENNQAIVMADMDRLVQVFRNLLENAVRYGVPQEKRHTQRIELWSEVRKGRVAFYVQDNGPGIPREERKRIFERFYRVDKHRAKDGSGSSGLGLAITRHMVLKMGGEIWVQGPADKGYGATFCFTLPEAATGPVSVETVDAPHRAQI